MLAGPIGRYVMDLIENLLEEVEGKKALDIGCGHGYYTSKLLQLGYAVDAIDISPENIDITKRRLKETTNSSNVNLHNIDLFEFDTKEKYDVIICLEVLEHLEKDVKALELMNAWLKDDGTLIISVPHREDLWNFRDEMSGHLRRYSKDEMKKKLDMANFKVKKMLCYGFPFVRFFLGLYLPIEKRYVNMRNKSTVEKSKNSGKKLTVRIFTWGINNMKKMSTILRYLLKFDTLFINTDRGFGLIVLAEKKNP
jgi:SAM-dependent methyltransferase